MMLLLYYIRCPGSKCPHVEHDGSKIPPKTLMDGLKMSDKIPQNIRFVLKKGLDF